MTGILLSGGMDSVCLAHWKIPDIAFTIDYGQRSSEGEVRAARVVAENLGIRHEVLVADCSALGSGDMAGQPPLEIAPAQDWWPFRNQHLLTVAGMRAVTLGIDELMFGTVASDTFHTDGTKVFFEQINKLFKLQEGSLQVITPAIELTTVQLVRESSIPRSLLAWSHSCHTQAFACGQCRGCVKAYSVMHELGFEDD